VIEKLLLPATQLPKEWLTTVQGTRIKASTLLNQIRTTQFVHNSASPLRWHNVVVAGGKNVRLDAAYLLNPVQEGVASRHVKWLVSLGGNGEMYELNLPGLSQLAQDTGLNVMAFNYRGVGHSR
jgi:hypothetical protein